ncbi:MULTISPECIES: AraC family transcriptional regulator [unclassified Desulfovibrio]|uniref:AraC family transcriptional regulator n=1 Tax=unclassified Desulfovibrio TaxID=2593640 RepID=UPI002FDA29DD
MNVPATGVDRINEQLKEQVLRWTPETGRLQTAIDGFMVVRRAQNNEVVNIFDIPLIGLTVQGFKHSVIGSQSYQYGEGHCLITGIDMPTSSRILPVSPDSPGEHFLAVALHLDRELIAQLAAETPPVQRYSGPHKVVAVAEADPKVVAAFLRLINLLDEPEEIPVMAPLFIREIHHRLLAGPQGEWLRTVCTNGTRTNQIARAITWLRENYKEPLRVDVLAQMVNMATSTFHRHFKEVTDRSPLQFQKQLRLYEAKRLMLFDSHDVNNAAYAVGYESSTQFIREYKREFGAPPRRDTSRLRPQMEAEALQA